MSAPGAGAGTGALPVSLGRRALAYVIDGAIAVGVFFLVTGFGAVGLLPMLRATRSPQALLVLVVGFILVVAAVNAAWLVVYTLMQAGAGSVGQRALGLRLVDADTLGPVGFWRALVRNVVWGLSCSVVVGYVSVLFDAEGRQRGWHDKAARAMITLAADAVDPITVSVTTVPGMLRPAMGAPSEPARPEGREDVQTAVSAAATRQEETPPAQMAAPSASEPPAPVTAAVPAAPPAAAPAMPASTPVAPAPTPVAPTPEPPAPATGLISAVPGVVGRAEASPTPAPGPEDARPARPVRRAHTVLAWDDGTRHAVYGRTLFGRNPAAQPDANAVSVRDETLSLSKTHFEVDGDGSGAWIIDRYSTNGVVLVRRGTRIPLVPGQRMPLLAGDRIEAGDRVAATEPGE